MKTVAIIQARMGSTRLPGKVLMRLAGEPMLARVVNRTRRSQTLDDVVVAITDLAQDDVLFQLCSARSWNCYRGSENDVLDRYYQTAHEYQADTIVRITADCPLIDPSLIDQCVKTFEASGADYVSNTLPHRTFPRGLDTEVFSFGVLENLWKENRNPDHREHVTLFIHKNIDSFRTAGVTNDQDLSAQRWTVDTSDDFEFIKKIYDHFQNDLFSWRDVVRLLEEQPQWKQINAHVVQKLVP
jgi:spore coat polysaccharide biosynthesis protein SpsF